MLGWGVADVERWCPETRLGRAGVRLTEVQTAVVLEGEVVKVPTSGLLLLCSVTAVLERGGGLGTTAFVLVGGGCSGSGRPMVAVPVGRSCVIPLTSVVGLQHCNLGANEGIPAASPGNLPSLVYQPVFPRAHERIRKFTRP